jgi:hypothetical protein
MKKGVLKLNVKLSLSFRINFLTLLILNLHFYGYLKIQTLSSINHLRQFVTFFELVFYLRLACNNNFKF